LFGRRLLLLLMTASIIFNLAAMALTVRYAGGGAIVEANPVTRSSIALIGNLAPIANFAVILLIYVAILRLARGPPAEGLGRFGAYVSLGLDFSALLLPIVTFLDVFNDVAVVFFGANLMTLSQLLSLAPLVAFDFVLASQALPLGSKTVTRLRTRTIHESV
jgi:hypothetical protein